MIKNYESDDTFLGRWISGELSEEERIAFEKTKAFKQFDIISKESQHLKGPDIDTEKALKIVKHKLKKQVKKPKIIKLWQSIAIASIIVISLGLFLTSTKTYTVAIGETQTIILDDGSTVELNSNSSLTHKRFFWNQNKAVKLNGEAYFNIVSGEGFEVHTSKGLITVLGTQFNVKDRAIFNLICFEGKVSFMPDDSKKKYILPEKSQIRIIDSKIKNDSFEDDTPDWKNGFTTFEAQPLSLVLEELKNHFRIEFDTKLIKVDRLFSGSFNNSDLSLALETTLTPMGILYKKSERGNTIILSE